MAHEHVSGLPGAYDRAVGRSEQQGVVFMPRDVQSAELNELQTIARGRAQRVSNLVASDGDRVEGAAAIVQVADGNVILTPGKIYLKGDVFPVASAVLSSVPMTGTVLIGVNATTVWLTHEDDTDLLGLVPGTVAEGEPGAAREVVTLAWAWKLADAVLPPSDSVEFFPVYELREGVIVEQTPPPGLSGVLEVLAPYDYGAHGNYIVDGCTVTALGLDGTDQVYSIAAGEANILGYKRTRLTSFVYRAAEDPDLGDVDGEVQNRPSGTTATLTLARTPIAAVSNILVTKEATVSVVRGSPSGGMDTLPNSSVTSIVSVTQGGTTYTATTDYVRSGDKVSWAPAGAEPAVGSTYSVTYRYLDAVTPSAVTATTVSFTGGVVGTTVIVTYTWKLPRIDLLCLDDDGLPALVRGVSAAENPLVPQAPRTLLKLCEITHSWNGVPAINNNGTRSIPYDSLWNLYLRVEGHDRLIQLERLKSGIDTREPVAKLGTFVDPFVDDSYRDAGVAQTGAINDGRLQLAITPTIFYATITDPVTLDYTDEVIISQTLFSSCRKINEYAVFNPMPLEMKVGPKADFWTDVDTVWESPIRREFDKGIRYDGGPLVVTEKTNRLVQTLQYEAKFCRAIQITVTIDGLGAGEHVDILYFGNKMFGGAGGAPLATANSSGVATYTFTIPSGVPAGNVNILAYGRSGRPAIGKFVAAGSVTVKVMQQVTSVYRWKYPKVTKPDPDPIIDDDVIKDPGGWTGGGNGSGKPTKDDDTGDDGSPNEAIRKMLRQVDPVAQSFTLDSTRQITGVDFRMCTVGGGGIGVQAEIVTLDNGYPTTDVQASKFIKAPALQTTSWVDADFDVPLTTVAGEGRAMVLKTDSNTHAVRTARLGAFDAATQKYITKQPYTVGVFFNSSNAETWQAYNDEDLAFRVRAAVYSVNSSGVGTKVVTLGTFALVNCSDITIRAVVERPSTRTDVIFEIVRASGEVLKMREDQVVQLTSYVTETVTLRARLTGTRNLSPILYAPVQLIAGSIASSATYVSKAFKAGSAVALVAYFKARAPAGSTITVQYDKVDNSWTSLPLDSTEVLSITPWVEQKRKATSITATQVRLKITMTGGPDARPEIGDLGAAVY